MPISILDKIFEKIIHKRLKGFADPSSLINHPQFGFHKENSTIHQLKRVVNVVEKNRRNRNSTGIIVLDTEKTSYRPISILSLLDKFFEKIIHKRLKDFADPNSLINHQQFGFHKENSTVQQVNRIVNVIEKQKKSH